ncbi:MAG: hypothetical protein K0Q47_20 [Sedimentibacter sp.]|jgi:hypothetical protein|nr:hypothetical protein [Sedimentibacter sp.]
MDRYDDDLQLEYLNNWKERREAKRLKRKFYAKQVRMDFIFLFRNLGLLLKNM